jgi:CPA2 family monovalent cation:H+ antiporter-2
MFGVGLHFSLRDLMSVRRIAIPGAIAQIASAVLLGMGLAYLFGWSTLTGFVFGFALSCASTVVLLRALEERRILDTERGRIAVGWLIVEDIVMVLALVLIPALAGGGSSAGELGMTLIVTAAKVAAFVALMLIVGGRAVPWLLHGIAHTGSRELFRLAVLAIALGFALAVALLFQVSFALGAFLAGVVLAESPLSQRAAEETLPLRDAFAVLFFVSVGMLFNPSILWTATGPLILTVLIVMVGKSVAAFLIVRAFGRPSRTAITISASLAQIGEFSFILGGMGMALGLLPKQGQNLILAGAILSIALNPLVFKLVAPLTAWLGRHPVLAGRMAGQDDPLAELPMSVPQERLTGQVVLVGYGRVGRMIGESLRAQHVPFVVAEQNRELVDQLRKRDIPAVAGNAAEPFVLIQAHIAKARLLVIATPDTLGVRAMVETAKALNPEITVLIRTHSADEAVQLQKDTGAAIFYGEQELALNMTARIREALGETPAHP